MPLFYRSRSSRAARRSAQIGVFLGGIFLFDCLVSTVVMVVDVGRGWSWKIGCEWIWSSGYPCPCVLLAMCNLGTTSQNSKRGPRTRRGAFRRSGCVSCRKSSQDVKAIPMLATPMISTTANSEGWMGIHWLCYYCYLLLLEKAHPPCLICLWTSSPEILEELICNGAPREKS